MVEVVMTVAIVIRETTGQRNPHQTRDQVTCMVKKLPYIGIIHALASSVRIFR